MSQIKRIGLDTSKAVFTLHCVDESGHAVLRTQQFSMRLSRARGGSGESGLQQLG